MIAIIIIVDVVKRVNTLKVLGTVYSVSVRYLLARSKGTQMPCQLGSSGLTEVMLCIWLICQVKKRQKVWRFQKDSDMI